MNDTQLDKLLNTCGSCDTPPGFHADVWNRIAVESESLGWLHACKQFLAETMARMAQPVGAIAAAVIFIIAGISAGISLRPEPAPPELQYIQSVSPFSQHSAR